MLFFKTIIYLDYLNVFIEFSKCEKKTKAKKRSSPYRLGAFNEANILKPYIMFPPLYIYGHNNSASKMGPEKCSDHNNNNDDDVFFLEKKENAN